MYIVSRYGGYGRGIWTSITDGTVEVKDRRNRVKVKVQAGIAVEETTVCLTSAKSGTVLSREVRA